MVIEHNGQTITLPDIPADVLEQYPYWFITKGVSRETDDIIHYLTLSPIECGFISEDVASSIGQNSGFIGAVSTGQSWYYLPDEHDDWTLSNDAMMPIAAYEGYHEGSNGDWTIIAANHDIKVVESIDASYNITWTDDIYFLNSTIEYEPEYFAPSSWFVGLADQARRLSGENKRYTPDGMLKVFEEAISSELINVEGVLF